MNELMAAIMMIFIAHNAAPNEKGNYEFDIWCNKPGIPKGKMLLRVDDKIVWQSKNKVSPCDLIRKGFKK